MREVELARSYPNIERSRFRWREYIGYDCNGCRYRIRKDGPRKDQGAWWVYPDSEGCIPLFYAGTLALVSQRLQERSSISAEFLAKQLLQCAAQSLILNHDGRVRQGIRYTANYLADSLAINNPRFDRERFMRACGIDPSHAPHIAPTPAIDHCDTAFINSLRDAGGKI